MTASLINRVKAVSSQDSPHVNVA